MNKEKEIEEIAKIIANQRGYGCATTFITTNRSNIAPTAERR